MTSKDEIGGICRAILKLEPDWLDGKVTTFETVAAQRIAKRILLQLSTSGDVDDKLVADLERFLKVKRKAKR